MQKKRSYSELVQRYRHAADSIGASLTTIGEFQTPSGSYEIHQMRLVCGDGRQRVCISTGMHGNEPGGPEALIEGLAELGRRRDELNADFLIYPCDNPTGYELDLRENWAGLDLNREFAREGQADEIAIVESSLAGKCFDLTYDLHEDYEMRGMYLYERARDGGPPAAESMIAALRAAGYPVHEGDIIDGRPASGGIILPSGRPPEEDGRFAAGLPKALYMWREGSRHLITTESPGLLPLGERVEMQMVCFNVMLDTLARGCFLPKEADSDTQKDTR